MPKSYKLYPAYPNPFNPITKIKYDIFKAAKVTLKIYNIKGETITTLINEIKQAGSYQVNWNAVNLPAGMYIYQLRVADYQSSNKILLLK